VESRGQILGRAILNLVFVFLDRNGVNARHRSSLIMISISESAGRLEPGCFIDCSKACEELIVMKT
jgi:hypothetical protein